MHAPSGPGRTDRRLTPSPAVWCAVALIAVGFALRMSWPLAAHAPTGGARPAFGTLAGDVPFGFHTDEGHNALDAWRIASEGWRPAFLERNNGREPLFMYLMAACLALLGPTIQAARATGALAGTAAIAAQLMFVRALPLDRPTRVALLSAACLAFTFWPIAQARYALRANLLPVWVALMLWAWWKAVGTSRTSASAGDRHRMRTASLAWAGLAGVFVGLAVHTHLTGRALPAILAVSALWVAQRERRARPLACLALALAVAGAVAWPQIDYFRRHPEMLSYRAEQVSVWNSAVNEGDPAGTFMRNGWNLARTPFLSGDTSWYHNIRGRPVFDDPVSAGAFLLGLAVLAGWTFGRGGRARRSAAVLLGAALVVTALPSWLSVGAPNFVRLTGTWPVLFLVPALGLDAAVRWIEARSGPLLPAGGSSAQPGHLPPARGSRGQAAPSTMDGRPANGWRSRELDGVGGRLRGLAGVGGRWRVLAGVGRRSHGPVGVGGRSHGPAEAGWRWRRVAALALLWLAPAWLLQDSARDYFGDYVDRDEVYQAFNGAAVERGQALAALPAGPLYVSPVLWNQAVIRFLAIERAPNGAFDPQAGIVLPPAADSAESRITGEPSAASRPPASSPDARYAFDPIEAAHADAFAARWPGAVRTDVRGRAGWPAADAVNLIVVSLEADAIERAVRAAAQPITTARFGSHIRLDRLGVPPEPVRAGESTEITLVWTALGPTEIDHNFFVRLISAADGRAIASFDGPPLGGSYPTDRWAPGERILIPLRLDVSPDAPAGPAALVHGWYDWRDGARLSLVEGSHAEGDADAAVIGRIEVEGR